MKNNYRKTGTIIYLHGNSSSSRIFQHLISSEGIPFSQIAFDLPGHGKLSEIHQYSNFTTKYYCDFLIDRIKDIDDDIFLVGNSMGGHLALEIANSLKRLKGLLLFGTPPVKKPINMEEAFFPVPALQTFLMENPKVNDVREAFKAIIHSETLIQGFVDDFRNTNGKVRTTLLNDLQVGIWGDQRKVFLELEIPKYIIIGSHDISVNSEYIKELAKESKPYCELLFFDQCGHYASIEKPKEFEKVIVDISKKIFEK